MRKRTVIIGLLLFQITLGAGVAGADSNLYVTPTAGLWKWDEEIAPTLELDNRSGFVYGGRVGYSPMEAFAGELVVLTGTNDATDLITDAVLSLRQTQIELSFLVNFQTLLSSPVYPFLDLGGGLAIRSGAEEGEAFDDTPFVFHLGGGLKAELGSQFTLRGNIRDTFFNDTQGGGNEENQVTVDSVEISLGLEYRIPLGRGGGPRRLR